MKKLTARDRANIMADMGYSFLSGKWFKKGVEVENIDREMYLSEELDCKEPSDKENALSVFRDAYGDMDGIWPTMPIIDEARAQKELRPMCFPLSIKQLTIINRLIIGIDEMIYIATGVGGSGKSTFGNIVRQIFGGDCASASLGDLCDDFKLAQAVGKRLVYSDELNSSDLKSGIIKTLASKQRISINPKYGRTYQVRFQGNMFFCCNKPPKMDIGDSGLLRRICYFSMNKKIARPDPSMQKAVYSHEDLVNIVAHALRDVNPIGWFEREFAEDTHRVLMEKNSVTLCPALNYESYRYQCDKKGYAPYNEDNWETIKATFEEWKKPVKQIVLTDEEVPW